MPSLGGRRWGGLPPHVCSTFACIVTVPKSVLGSAEGPSFFKAHIMAATKLVFGGAEGHKICRAQSAVRSVRSARTFCLEKGE
eukprot:1159014-Pelagomonas_calceolata.AAC.12